MDEPLLTVEQVAQTLQVHPETVRRWLREGRLQGYRISRRAGYRVRPSEIERFLRGDTPEGKAAA